MNVHLVQERVFIEQPVGLIELERQEHLLLLQQLQPRQRVFEQEKIRPRVLGKDGQLHVEEQSEVMEPPELPKF